MTLTVRSPAFRTAFGFTFVALLAGCSLIAAPDESKLPKNDGGSGATGGAGGAGCTVATDCPAASGECQTATCVGGQCGVAPKAAGTPASTQVLGDCQKAQCDGAGNATKVADDTDVPVDGKDCTNDVCTAGVPSNPAKSKGDVCGSAGELTCDGQGNCTGCTQPSNCGADKECQHPTCTNGVCGVNNEMQGKLGASQTAGDCKKNQCDGAGSLESVADNTDPQNDNETCTTDTCNSGNTTDHTPVATGNMCTENGGKLCSMLGTCVQCLIATDCPGSDDECSHRTCNAGTCGVAFTQAGTAVASQTAGDCKKQACNGSGAVTSINDDGDLPNDNNPCTTDTCSAGTKVFTNVGSGNSCGGTLVCNGSGQCVGCNVPGDCPGTDDECKSRTCNANTCGFSFTGVGTAVASQVAGDCKENQCDGSGNIVSANKNTDVPADDANQCTGETCNNGTPTHPPASSATTCNQGGVICDGAGTCVACNIPSQCSGSDTECSTRTCSAAHACGVSFQSNGFVTPTQTTGDCKQNQCNGSGSVVVVAFNTDVPLDDGFQCTDEVCTAGVPSHPPIAINQTCNQNGGAFCDGGGACVQCNQSSQCVSMICDTGAHTCTAASCNDSVQNGDETDVDCGGTCATKCGPAKGCMANSDCAGAACNMTTHQCAPTCPASDPLAPNATCDIYCTCMTSACNSTFGDYATCIASCASMNESQLCCRAYHCTAAVGDPATHCPHANGIGLCQ